MIRFFLAALTVLTLAVPGHADDPPAAAEGSEPARPATPPAVEAEAAPPIPEGLELAEGWYARFDTGMGTFIARLLPGQSPQAVAHFTALAQGRLAWYDPYTGKERNDPYYVNVPIHKVEAGLRLEVGDRTGTGMGAPPFWIPQEGGGPVNFHRPWRLGMTRASLGRISGSLFFVTSASQPWLTGRHPCFGTVEYGRETVLAITEAKAYSNGKPVDEILLENVRIFSVGEPDPLPEPERYEPEARKLEFRKRSVPKKRP